MPLSPGFIDYALDLVGGMGRVEAKRMFGGAGLYCDGVMFAVLDDDVMFLRVDEALQAELMAMGSSPWSYSMKKDGTVREMGYWRLPETAADEPETAVRLAQQALTAAISRKAGRAARPRSRKSK